MLLMLIDFLQKICDGEMTASLTNVAQKTEFLHVEN
jgi:hypothetical protein